MEKPANVVRKDGDPETAFKNAAQIIERTYTGPFPCTQLHGADELFCSCYHMKKLNWPAVAKGGVD